MRTRVTGKEWMDGDSEELSDMLHSLGLANRIIARPKGSLVRVWHDGLCIEYNSDTDDCMENITVWRVYTNSTDHALVYKLLARDIRYDTDISPEAILKEAKLTSEYWK